MGVTEVERPADKNGMREKNIGFKLPDGSVRVADKGFDYNIGRLSYRPNLDLYPEKLAHQFAKAEMSGEEFKYDFNRLEKAVTEIKQQINQLGKKLTADQMLQVRNNLTKNIKFAAGVLSAETKVLLKTESGTVWLSDDTLIKQINSRDGQAFGIESYALFPDIFNQPDILLQEKDRFYFIKNFEEQRLLVVVKHLIAINEIFVLSAREINVKEVEKLKAKLAVVK